MARYVTAIALPAQLVHNTADGLPGCLTQALLAMGVEVIMATRWQLVANDSTIGEEAVRLVCSWSTAPQDSDAVVVTFELISREPMGTGAPRTQAAIDRLLKGLGEQLGTVRVLSDSRTPTAQPTAAGGAIAAQSAIA